MKKTNKLWGSAFEKAPSEEMINFTAGRDVNPVPPCDQKLIKYDILVNKAHCKMLAKQKIISKEDSKKILDGLNKIEESYLNKNFNLDPSKEDIHSNIESKLTEIIGIEVAGKLHTARSRNDQIATDMRLYLKDNVINLIVKINSLITTLESKSNEHKETIMPGFTHFQHATITTFGHTLHAYKAMLEKDVEKLYSWIKIHDKCPLGGAASFGTSFPIDRHQTANELGFSTPEKNSMEPIMNRWEAEADFAYAISSMMNHLSSFSQFIITLTTPQFGMIKLADEFSTGSSIMPQKKNPDPLEVIKGKASYASGQLMSLINIGQSNFIGYNRDSQWTKYIIMDLIDECIDAPTITKGIIETFKINKKEMEKWCYKGFIGATNLMEQISQEFNVPFRIAKILTENAIKYSESKNLITIEGINKAKKKVGLTFNISKIQVEKWQDPKEIIKRIKSFGSPGNFI